MAGRVGTGAAAGTLVLIGGTTVSGKSALATTVARAMGGVVLNADSQQLFADLPVLTARPTPEDLGAVLHRLYGVLGPERQPSVGAWLALVEPELQALRDDDRVGVLVGGTGLYLSALLRGLPELPRVPAERRAALAHETADMATPELHALLAAEDPPMAARLRPSDRQRILRALEVVRETGRSLLDWQAGPVRRPKLPGRLSAVALLPPPEITAPRIAARLAAQLSGGAVAEVMELARRLPGLADLPIGKVHGVREILAWQAGRLGEAEAFERIAAQVRQYAKRQRTFLRHQLPELPAVAALGEDLGAEALVPLAVR